MKLSLLILLILLNGILKGQDSFEKYPALIFKEYNGWKLYEKENRIHHTLEIPSFYDNKDTLTIQLTSFIEKWDSSYIRIYRNKNQIHKLNEPMGFSPSNINESLKVADINGDSLSDIKLVIPYNGNGIASLNVRIIYLFQKTNGSFTKLSFDDKIDKNRPERDFDGDQNYEIITMTLTSFENHSYWLYNIFNFKSNNLINVNYKDDYPIMIQFLHRENYEITNKITRQKMKDFSLKLPDGYFNK